MPGCCRSPWRSWRVLVALTVPAGAAESPPQEGSGTLERDLHEPRQRDHRQRHPVGLQLRPEPWSPVTSTSTPGARVGHGDRRSSSTSEAEPTPGRERRVRRQPLQGRRRKLLARRPIHRYRRERLDTDEPTAFVQAPADEACNTFGTTWTRDDLANDDFRVRVAAHPRSSTTTDAPAETMQIDDIDVRVCWAARNDHQGRRRRSQPGRERRRLPHRRAHGRDVSTAPAVRATTGTRPATRSTAGRSSA